MKSDKTIHRTANITPKKIGQFVSIWKRNQEGITVPYEISDDFDFMIISTKKDNKAGQFIFPKAALLEQGIISTENKEGKRGIRVYPPWDTPENKQAIKTQAWQVVYWTWDIGHVMDNIEHQNN